MNAKILRAPVNTTRGVAALVEGAGAVLVFIGAYVPWAVTSALITVVPVRGIDTHYGRVLPLIPLVALGLLAWRWYVRRARWAHAIILGLGILAVALTVAYVVGVKRDLARVEQSVTRSLGQAFPGTIHVQFDAGIYLTVAGGVAMFVGGLIGSAEDRSRSQTSAATDEHSETH